MTKYIKDKLHSVRGRLSLLDELLKTESKELNDQSPYQMFTLWFLEYVVQYGILITIIWNVWFEWQGWNNISLVIANGFVVWLWKEFIRITKEAVRD